MSGHVAGRPTAVAEDDVVCRRIRRCNRGVLESERTSRERPQRSVPNGQRP
jgi:hypothetical protein